MQSTELIKQIGESGIRVFGMNELRKIAEKAGISSTYLPKLVRNLIRQGLLRQCMRGVYTLQNSLLSGPPLSEFEIAAYLIQPSALCCWSAFSIHHLTDQVIRNVYMLSPLHETAKNTPKYIYEIDHTKIIVIRVQPNNFFGIEQKWLTEIPVHVTDLERTLVDGLVRPNYCGGFFDVLHGFEQAIDRINSQKITDYAKRYSLAAVKRLGWVLDNLKIYPEAQDQLLNIKNTNVHKLDPSRKNTGVINKKWNIQENLW